MYGCWKKTVSPTFAEVRAIKGLTGDTLLGLLERRLDNVALTALASRLARSGSNLVQNGGTLSLKAKKVNILHTPSERAIVVLGKEPEAPPLGVQSAMEGPSGAVCPDWAEVDREL